MPWKTEIDRLVHHLVLDAARGSPADLQRATQAVCDLATLAPERDVTYFHAGSLEEVLLDRAAAAEEEEEGLEALREGLPTTEAEGGARWRHVGRLDGAARNGRRERVFELMEDPTFTACLDHAEGRVALRAVGRMLLKDGRADEAFDLYRRHLASVADEGSRRDAEFLLEESLRRADRRDADETETLERLDRAAAFAEDSGLDARARSKVDRKLGRLHQLGGRAEEASACYRRALDRLTEDDPYRSVLLGDLALATLGVRGTLDLLPDPDREHREAAEEILRSGLGGEGRSYNAIYTLGMLAYERGDWEAAAASFREADQLMRDNRAKARIVHARSRFFLARCLLALGAEGEDLDQAERWILKNAGAVSLDPEIKGTVIDALRAVKPDVRVPGRGSSGRPPRANGRAARGGGGPRASAAEHLAAARERLADDPHASLELVDRAFKSRPDFDTWFGAYRTRLDALVALGEQDEAVRTYERFRSKLYQREAVDRLEAMLTEEDGIAARLFDQAARSEELAALYEFLPDRAQEFARACADCAAWHLESDEPLRVARAVALYREAAAQDPDSVGAALEQALETARSVGVAEDDVPKEEIAQLLKGEEDPVRLVVVGGDGGRTDLVQRFEALAAELGFEGSWIVTGVRAPYRTVREISGAAQEADVLLLHHALGADLRRDVHALGEKLDVPVREAAWLGASALEQEVLHSLKEAFEE